MQDVARLDSNNLQFPPIDHALVDPNGLLAIGGDLSTQRLLIAYRHGIFPWYEDGQPLLWWSPNPRAVLFPDELRVSRSLAKRLRRNEFQVRLDTCFTDVIYSCARSRDSATETWITTDMQHAYINLHHQGAAHSIECFQDDILVGGLYGVSLGKMFFGESMFHSVTDASKVAFAYLCRLMREQNCPLIDCQLENHHLSSLGCESMSRTDFRTFLDQYCDVPDPIDWHDIPSLLPDW